jgi:predicted ATPase
MIKKVELNNFKSHSKTELDFSNLTVLCGANGVGKSSVIQALLLLRESFFNKSQFDYLDLKSNPVTVGTAKDALYQFSLQDEITFKILSDIQSLEFGFEIKDPTKTLIPKSNHVFDNKKLETEPLFSKNCQFISAARSGPQTSYLKDDVVVDIYNQISVIEGKAEHFVHFLQRKKDCEVIQELCLPNIKATDLFSQVTAWEREISSGVNIIIQDIGNLGYELKYQFNTSKGKTNDFKASNVGFGVSYVMPVIVAILYAPKDSILFIENPEAHLHPHGQAKLAELIALAAQNGIQIVIETHSDHIINGILVQCKDYESEQTKGISKNNVSIYHFNRDGEKHCTKAEKVNIEEDGRIIYAPKGFFDQFTIDRKRLMGF